MKCANCHRWRALEFKLRVHDPRTNTHRIDTAFLCPVCATVLAKHIVL